MSCRLRSWTYNQEGEIMGQCVQCNDTCNQCLKACQANNKIGPMIDRGENRLNYSFTMNGIESCS